MKNQHIFTIIRRIYVDRKLRLLLFIPKYKSYNMFLTIWAFRNRIILIKLKKNNEK